MPTQTFFNLPKEKQEKLINSALNEFSKMSFHEVSVSNIINGAHISRGSFYMYFNNKEDLFEYLLFSHKNYFEQVIINSLNECEGNLKEAFIRIYDEGVKYKNIRKCRSFLTNVFTNLSCKNEAFLISGNDLFKKVKDKIDVSKFKDIGDLEIIFQLLLNNMFVSLVHSDFESNKNISRDNYLKKLDIICNGFYRREK